MSGLEPRPWVRDLDLYIGGKSKISGVAHPVKLSSNESALGPSPAAASAFAASAPVLHRYPDATSLALRQTIGATYNVDPERVVCGVGSDEILNLACRAYAGPGDEVIFARHSFMMYPIAAKSVGATPVEVADIRYTASVDNILAAITPRTRIIFLANPNNPTGTYLPKSDVEQLIAGTPDNVLLVLDAAYEEYVDRPDYTCGLDLAKDANNILVTHTFSKIYGLAALRLGWGYASDQVIEIFNHLRDPFNVPTSSQLAGIAALQDRDFLAKARAHNNRWRDWLAGRLTSIGLKPVPGVANFILIEFPDDAAHCAEAANRYLTQNGYILRWLPNQGLGNCLRMTVGLEDENKAVIKLLEEFMKV